MCYILKPFEAKHDRHSTRTDSVVELRMSRVHAFPWQQCIRDSNGVFGEEMRWGICRKDNYSYLHEPAVYCSIREELGCLRDMSLTPLSG